ncbi:MAG: hypothetical protein JO270_05100 [Acidobacteriaceae bacterium]|nr:hypothetical protein [Acidobacteriaceae bacterium]MBV8573069.1 hypothetical protein [Acidobacteriaceae bacterium]
MALFTDANVVTEDDLLEYETALDSIAASHGIDINTKITLATNAIADKLMLWLLNVGASDPQWMSRRLLGLSTVVVTPTLQRWLCFDSLSRFFSEAYNVQLNTRFDAKLTEYKSETERAADAYFQSGVGIVYKPLPRPLVPLVSVETGSAPQGGLFVQTAWVNDIGEESAVSAVNGSVLTASSSVVIGMAEGVLKAPPAACGWNVYAGSTNDSLTRQNLAPLPIGATWQLPATGLIDGPDASGGQQPNCWIQLSRQIRRG